MQWIKSTNCDITDDRVEKFVELFCANYRTWYGAAMLVDLLSPSNVQYDGGK